MAIQLDQKGPLEAEPVVARRDGRQVPPRDTRTARDGLVQVARQTLVQMRGGRRKNAWIARPRGGTRA
jgi:hypothetical protein